MTQKIPVLTHKELTLLVENLNQNALGLSVDRVFIPARSEFIEGYLKSEWVLRLGTKNKGIDLLLSLRNQSPYLAPYPFGTFKNYPAAAHMGFDLALIKYIVGRRLLKVFQVDSDRWVQLQFSGNYSVWMALIPAAPLGYLIDEGQTILGHNRTQSLRTTQFLLPEARSAPLSTPPPRIELMRPLANYSEVLQLTIAGEALDLRSRHLEKVIRENLKHLKKLKEKNTHAFESSKSEKNWHHFAELLKHSSFEPETQKAALSGFRKARDFETGEFIEVPCDPSLDLQAQIRKYYSLEKRKQKRALEAERRLTTIHEDIIKNENLLETLAKAKNLDQLRTVENSLGITANSKDTGRNTTAAPGRLCLSKEGLTIRVGRDKDENLELTLKHAKGRDLWLHIKGRPSSHAIIELPPKKSASLETLLDAAHLVLHFSKAQTWGKTEVDYTFRKHVKRVPKSDEVIYTHNKTLVVEHDQKRIDRLLGA